MNILAPSLSLYLGITPLQISMMNSDKISTDILIRSGANLKLVVSLYNASFFGQIYVFKF